MRMGIMGGTFDPIHYGHLFVAEEARVRFELDTVVFVPNGTPPHKKEYETTPARHRYAMVECATASNHHFRCSPVELNRPGPSYTVETLLALRQDFTDEKFYYITGVDAVADILTWKRHAEVIRMATFIAAARPGFDPGLKCLPPAYRERILLLESTALDISSTEIRSRVREGRTARYLTPDCVLDYVFAQSLYTDDAVHARLEGEDGK